MGASIIGRRTARVSTQDGRCAEARLLRKTRAGFVAHLGGKPSATQAALIDRAAMLTVHLARMDTKARETGEFSDHAGRQYLAWSSALARLVRQLGLEGQPPPKARWTPHQAPMPHATRAERQAAMLAKDPPK